MIVEYRQTKRETYSNCKLRGIHFKAYLVAAAANNALIYTDIDPNQISVKATLHRGKSHKQIFQEVLGVLNASSNFENVKALLSMPASNGYANYNGGGAYVQTAAAAGIKEVDMIPYEVDLGGFLDLTGSDKLEVEVTFSNGCLSANVDGTASYIDFVEHKVSQEYEFATPRIQTYSIQAGQGRVTEDLGHGVVKIMWMNFDKADQLSSSAVISNVTVDSSDHSANKTYIDVISEQSKKFQDPNQQLKRGQSVVLYEGAPIDNAKISFLLNAANVNATKNWLVIFKQEISPAVSMHASASQQVDVANKGIKHGVLDASNRQVAAHVGSMMAIKSSAGAVKK